MPSLKGALWTAAIAVAAVVLVEAYFPGGLSALNPKRLLSPQAAK
jgi:hypothetical protein